MIANQLMRKTWALRGHQPISTPSPLRPAIRTCEEPIRFIASWPRTYSCRLYKDSSISPFLSSSDPTDGASFSILDSWEMKLLAGLSFDVGNQDAGEWGCAYCHDLPLVRAAMLVRKFPLTQRGRLRDISVGANGGCCNSACTEASPTCRLRFVEKGWNETKRKESAKMMPVEYNNKRPVWF